MTQNRELLFERLSQPELQRYADVGGTVLLPVGAVEQHGPHLPVDTDIFNARTFSMAAAAEFDDVLVAPSIPWGLSYSHLGRGGTLSVRPATYLELAMDLTSSFVASGFERLVWINGHHGNKPILSLLVYEAKRVHGLSVGAVTYYDLAVEEFDEVRASALGGAGHACEFETSLMLHVRPDLVGDFSSVARPVERRTDTDMEDLLHPGTTAIGYTFVERFPEGVMGDPTGSTAETGRVIHDAALDKLTRFVDQFRRLPPRGVLAGGESNGPDHAKPPHERRVDGR